VYNENSDIIGLRLLDLLDYVIETDSTHGFLVINTSLTDDIKAELEYYLTAKIANGEQVRETYSESRGNAQWGVSPYYTVYDSGDFVTKSK
jgi:hypothetical protein